MGFRELVTTGILSAATIAHGAGAQTVSPPPLPPSIKKSDKDHLAMLMVSAYDIHKATYDKALGVTGMQPATILVGKPKSISAEYTDKDQIKAFCKDIGLDPAKVACVSVSGDELTQNYYFLTDRDPMKGDVVATATSIKYESIAGKDEKKGAGKIPAAFWVSHITGTPPSTAKVVFGFKEGNLGIHIPGCKCNIIEMRYNNMNETVVPTHIVHSAEGTKTKELEPYPVAKLEEALRQRKPKLPDR